VTFSATLDRTVQLYRVNFSRLLAIAVLGGLPQLPFALALDPGTKKPPTFHVSFTAVALGILAILFATLTSAALVKVAIAIHDDAPIGAGEAFRAAVPYVRALRSGVSCQGARAIHAGAAAAVGRDGRRIRDDGSRSAFE